MYWKQQTVIVVNEEVKLSEMSKMFDLGGEDRWMLVY